MNPLNSLRGYTAHLFAKAAQELFPSAKLISVEVDEIGFRYVWECPQDINNEMLPLFEERMRGWVKNPPSFRLQEMIPSNAASLFKDKKQPYLEEYCHDSEDELIQVVCIGGDFVDVACVEDPEQFDNFAFKLLSLNKKDKIVEISGTAFETSDELKSFVKKLKEVGKRDWKEFTVLSKYAIFPHGESPLFMPKGVAIQRKFFNYSVNTLPTEAVEVRTPRAWDKSVAESHTLLYAAGAGAELWETRDDKLSIHFFTDDEMLEGVMKSSLQLFEKTAKILRFEAQWTLGGIYPPKFENRKKIKERWRGGVNLLKQALSGEGIEYTLDERAECREGPYFQLRFLDVLGRSIEGPKLGINCVAFEQLGLAERPGFQGKWLISRELFPSLDSLVFKLIEAGSLKQVEVELEK